MLCSRPTRWILALVYSAFVAVGCTATTDTSGGETGSLSLNLEVGSVEIDEVDYLITGNGTVEGGAIDTSAPGSTASVEVFGLLPGDYTVTLSATATDGVTMCEGSEDFSVDADALTEVMVYLRCKLPETLGGVRVNGQFNVCAVVKESVVKPLQTSVGNVIELSAMGEDAEGDNITYIWSGTGGDIDDPNAMDTTYTCEEVGKHSVTIRVSDDGFEYCMDSWTTVVTCVEGEGSLCDIVVCKPDGNECTENNCDPSDGICKDENVDDGTDCKDGLGMCMDGKCIDADLCEGVDCSDGEECTDDSCNPLNGECINAPVDDGTDCGDGTGMCVGGECIAEDLCDGVTCEDTGNDCTVGVCNMQTGVCDPMDVEPGTPCNDGAGACAGGECLDNNLCDTVDCTSSNDCMQDGTCNPLNGECIPGDDEPLGTPCADGVCNGQGTCLGCNVPDDCTGDLGQCEAKACIDNACSIVIIVDGAPCDFAGAGDGVCEAGTCVEAPECNSDGDCDDSNVCTTESCVDGMCGFDPNDGAECDADGLPGLCEASACVGLCEGVTCPDLGECMANECNASTGDCDALPTNEDGPCNGGLGTCTAGECIEGCTVPAPVDAIGIPMACRNSFQVKAVSEFPIDLQNITADDCILEGEPVNFDMDPVIALDTAFLQAAANTLCGLGTPLTEAVIELAQVAVDAVAGLTCTETLSELSPVPQTITIDATVDGTCGAGGSVTINSGVSVPLAPLTLPCSAGGTAGSEVQICSVGTTPIQASIDLATEPVQTFVGVSVGGGNINIVFQCGTSSTTNPPPGVENQVGCAAPNPSGPCDDTVGMGNTGETLPNGTYPVSNCDFLTPPATPQDCGDFDCPGTCTAVPIAVDPSTVCAIFTVE